MSAPPPPPPPPPAGGADAAPPPPPAAAEPVAAPPPPAPSDADDDELQAAPSLNPEPDSEPEPEPEPEPELAPVPPAEPEAAPASEPEPAPAAAPAPDAAPEEKPAEPQPEGLTPGPDDIAVTASAQDKIDEKKDELDAQIDDAMAPKEGDMPEVSVPAGAEGEEAPELTAADADDFMKGLEKMKDPDMEKAKSMSLESARKYLNLTVAPLIKGGVQQIARELPSDPVESLAKYLETHHPNPKKKPVIFVFGARGSGKDVCCERIAKEFGWAWVQAGDVLRAEVEGKSEDGKRITECIQKGQTVPSDMTIRLLKKTFDFVEGPGILLDGFPRKIDQAGLFEKEMESFRGAIHFHVRKEVAMERVLSGIRKYTTYDPKDRFEKRWKTYIHHTGPILEYYKAAGKLTEVNASRHPEDVFAELRPMFAPIYKV